MSHRYSSGSLAATTTPLPDSTSGAAGSSTALARADHQHPTASLLPSDLGYLAWPLLGPVCSVAGSAMTSGTVYVAKVKATATWTPSQFNFNVGTAASGLTAGQCFVGLFTLAGALIGISADCSATIGTTTGTKQVAISPQSAGSLTNLAAGEYYAAILQNGTTPATLRAGSGSAICVNGVLSNANSRWASANTAQTSMPTTLGSLTAFASSFFIGIS